MEQVSPVCSLAFSFLAARTTSIPDLSIVLFGKPTKGQHGAGVGFATLITRHNVNGVHVLNQSSGIPQRHARTYSPAVTQSLGHEQQWPTRWRRTHLRLTAFLRRSAWMAPLVSLLSSPVHGLFALDQFVAACFSRRLQEHLHACWATCHQRRWALWLYAPSPSTCSHTLATMSLLYESVSRTLESMTSCVWQGGDRVTFARSQPCTQQHTKHTHGNTHSHAWAHTATPTTQSHS